MREPFRIPWRGSVRFVKSRQRAFDQPGNLIGSAMGELQLADGNTAFHHVPAPIETTVLISLKRVFYAIVPGQFLGEDDGAFYGHPRP